jgi:hypothetical protein
MEFRFSRLKLTTVRRTPGGQMTARRPNKKPGKTMTAAKRLKPLRVDKETLRDLTPQTGKEVKGGIKTCNTQSNGTVY